MEYEKTYVQALLDSLEQKSVVLERVMSLTLEQEQILITSPFDLEKFDGLCDEKDICIKQLEQLDQGFENVFARVREVLKEQKVSFQKEIQSMQVLIQKITEQSISLKALEAKNKVRFESQMRNQRNDIRSFRKSNETATNYYKNMANQHQGQSYFYDKKK